MISLRLVSVMICVVLTLITAALTLAVTLSFTQKAVDDLGQRYSSSLATNLKNSVEQFMQAAVNQYLGLAQSSELSAIGPPNTTWTPGWNGSVWTFNYTDLKQLDTYYKPMTAVMASHNFTRESTLQMCFVDGTLIRVVAGSSAAVQFSWQTFVGKGPALITPASPTYGAAFVFGFNKQVVSTTPLVVTHPTPWNMPCTGSQACTAFECRTRPTFLSSIPYGRGRCWWIAPYISTYTTAVTGVHCTMYNGLNQRLGVAASIMPLTAVSNFVASIERTANGHAFAIDAVNWGLLGSSYASLPFQQLWRWSNATYDEPTHTFRNSSAVFPISIVPATAKTPPFANVGVVSANATYIALSPKCLVGTVVPFFYVVCQRSVDNYGYQPLRALQQAVGLDPSLGFRQGILPTPEGRFYYAMDGIATHANGYLLPGLRWTVVILTPDGDVLAKVVAGRTYSIIATVMFFVFAAVCCYVLFAIFLRPLEELEDKMLMTANLADEKDTDEPLSKLTEVRNMQKSFYKLRAQLRRLKSFVPQSVLAALDDDDDDEASGPGSAAGHSVVVESVRTAQSGAKRATDQTSNVPSSRGSAKKSNHYTVSSGGQAVRLLNMQVGLVKKIVSVLLFNVYGVHSQLKSISPEEFAHSHAKLVEHFHAIVTQEKGIVDSFQGDRFVATFNAVTNNAQHAVRACVAAQQIVAGVSKLKVPFARSGVGIASGEALVGNAGTESLRRFCTVGRVYTQATVMERLTKQHPTADVIISTGTTNQVRHEFYYEALDVVSLEGSSKPALVFALRARMNHAMEEWNYAMLQNESKDKYSTLNEAFAKFVEGDATASRALLSLVAEGDRDLDGYQRLQSILRSTKSATEEAASGQGPFFAASFGPSLASSLAAPGAA